MRYFQFLVYLSSLLNFLLFQYCISNKLTNIISRSKAYPVDAERKLNVHETFRRRPGYLIYVQFTYSVYGVKAIFKKDSVLVKLGVIHYTIFVLLKVLFMEELLLFHNVKIHLIQAAKATDIDVKSIMDTWTKQMGYPVLNVTRNGDDVIVTQQHFLIDQDAKPKKSPFG